MKENLVLHICCGPCAAYSIPYFSENYNISGYFFNPNIYPQSEYQARLNALFKLVNSIDSPIDLFCGQYVPQDWQNTIKDTNFDKEGGERCSKCIRMRLESAALFAAHRRIKFFSTTLTISPHKNADLINSIGAEIAREYNLEFLAECLRKNNGFKKSMEIAKKFELYIQNYCGCTPR